jgi:SAM-dependent methyltransferase
MALRTDCPICRGRDLLPLIDFEALPLFCNKLYSDLASAKAAPVGHFDVMFCRRCSHVFNASFEEDLIEYSEQYDSSLHFSARFAEFEESLAQRLRATYALAGKTVVDIGCGKGSFLKRLCAVSGTNGVGFDKSFEMDRLEASNNVRFVNDWFSDAHAEVQPSFVSCRHVLEHIADPILFLRALRSHPGVSAETIFYFEVPNALYTLRDMGIWDLIYEHVSYFTPSSLGAAFRIAGFDVLGLNTWFGEQYLSVEARLSPTLSGESFSDSGATERLVRNFNSAYRSKIDHWQKYLATRDLQTSVVWGAGSKGLTFINVVPSAYHIGALVDVNPHKRGRFAPRTGTPVLSPEALRGRPIGLIIISNSHYHDEISLEAMRLGLTPEIVAA